MFSKKTCQRCGKKTGKGNNFCPSCGFPLGKKGKKEEFGMLGENDSFNETDMISNSLFGGMMGNVMNKMISNTMRMLEKEMEKEMRMSKQSPTNNNFPKTKIKLMINGKEVDLNSGMQKQGENKKEKQESVPLRFKKFSKEQIKKFSKLNKKEPKTELRRIADKIIYEIEMPGVESIENITITPLESSIELRAIAEEKAYSKSIPLNLPIIGYEFSKGLLVLEFKGN